MGRGSGWSGLGGLDGSEDVQDVRLVLLQSLEVAVLQCSGWGVARRGRGGGGRRGGCPAPSSELLSDMLFECVGWKGEITRLKRLVSKDRTR